ncbi:MAG: hypothetical protein ABS81_10220 [Pseudonocardia sp. SCN 72-86]|nr:MAG: hypothetical protein ABS81_10220 [Pseudonocardia sp. SCN 72-86]
MSTRPVVVLPGLTPGLAATRTHAQLVETSSAGAVLDPAGLLAGAATSSPTLDTFVEGIAAELEQTGLDDVTVVAESFAATAALRLAATHPDRITELVLIAPIGFVSPLSGPGRGRASLSDIASSLYSGDPDRTRTALIALGVPGDVTALAGEYSSAVDDRAREAGGVLTSMIGSGEFDRAGSAEGDGLREVRKPVNLIWGRDDVCAPLDSAFYLERRLREAQLRVVPNVGHLLLRQWGPETVRFIGAVLRTDVATAPGRDQPLVETKGA